MVHIPGHPAPPNLLRQQEEKRKDEQDRQNCETRGGTWDNVRKVCKFPTPEPKEPTPETEIAKRPRPTTPEPTPPPQAPPIIKLTPEERLRAENVRGINIITDEFGNERIQTPFDRETIALREGREFTAAEQIAIKREAAIRGQGLAAQVGVETPIGELQPTELAGTGQTQLRALKGAFDGAVNKGLTFGGAGVAAGLVGGPAAPITVPVGAATGAAVGIVVGAVEGYIDGRDAAIKDQASGNEGAALKQHRGAKTVMTRVIASSWAGRGDKDDLLIVYNTARNDDLRVWAQLQVDTQNNPQLRRGVDGTTTLAAFEEFYGEGGQDEIFQQEFKEALISAPDIERSMFWTSQSDINELAAAAESR